MTLRNIHNEHQTSECRLPGNPNHMETSVRTVTFLANVIGRPNISFWNGTPLIAKTEAVHVSPLKQQYRVTYTS